MELGQSQREAITVSVDNEANSKAGQDMLGVEKLVEYVRTKPVKRCL